MPLENGIWKGFNSYFQKMRIKNVWREEGSVRFDLKKLNSFTWKRRKTTLSALSCATGAWGLKTGWKNVFHLHSQGVKIHDYEKPFGKVSLYYSSSTLLKAVDNKILLQIEKYKIFTIWYEYSNKTGKICQQNDRRSQGANIIAIKSWTRNCFPIFTLIKKPCQ